MKGKCNTSKSPQHLQNHKKFYKVIGEECVSKTFKVRIRVLLRIRPIVGTIYFVSQVLMKN
jgi:hypothetical protein